MPPRSSAWCASFRIHVLPGILLIVLCNCGKLCTALRIHPPLHYVHFSFFTVYFRLSNYLLEAGGEKRNTYFLRICRATEFSKLSSGLEYFTSPSALCHVDAKLASAEFFEFAGGFARSLDGRVRGNTAATEENQWNSRATDKARLGGI